MKLSSTQLAELSPVKATRHDNHAVTNRARTSDDHRSHRLLLSQRPLVLSAASNHVTRTHHRDRAEPFKKLSGFHLCSHTTIRQIALMTIRSQDLPSTFTGESHIESSNGARVHRKLRLLSPVKATTKRSKFAVNGNRRQRISVAFFSCFQGYETDLFELNLLASNR